jgi:hypothetical protein
VAALRTFIDLVEPVKHYKRGGTPGVGNQLVPLIGLADAAQPESEPSREFAASVDEMLFAPGGDRPGKRRRPSKTSSDAWGAAGREVADTLALSYPAVREAVARRPRARQMPAPWAPRRVQALASGVPIDAGRLSADLAHP